MMNIILASNNQHKVDELAALFATCSLPIQLISQKEWFKGAPPEIEESGLTLHDNAALKANALYSMTGMPVISDDTGLEVYTLDMAPGVFSARYAGIHGDDRANRSTLLEALLPKTNRAARFRTVLHFMDNQTTLISEGICEGTIAMQERGIHGFGYDSIFIPEGQSMTFAEMSQGEKQEYSHRAKAGLALGNLLQQYIMNMKQ